MISGKQLRENLVCQPYRMIVSGSSCSGKTRFVESFLSSDLVEKPSKIYYFYNDFLENYEDWNINEIPFVSIPGLPTDVFFKNLEENSVIIIDDQYSDVVKSKVMTTVMQVLSRHSKFSIILITQNLFLQGPECRNIR